MIEITFKLDIQEYIKLILILLYTRIRMVIITLLGLFFLILSVIDFAFSLYLFDNSPYYDIYFFSVGFFIVCINPLWMRFRIKRVFKSNKKLGETITYTFYEAKYTVKGESFFSEMVWNSLYEVFESKNYLLLYHSRQSAHIIPKRFFQPETMKQLRAIIKNVPGIRISGLLKNNIEEKKSEGKPIG